MPTFRLTRSRRLAGAVLAIGALTATAVPAAASPHPSPSASSSTSASPSGGRSSHSTVVSVPIVFSVRNINRSKVSCASDGKTYHVRGDLVAPSSALRGGVPSVTLYLHGLSFGEYLWDFKNVSGYDYARTQAQHGLASVVLDRLGYGKSDKPNGFGICAGSRADIAHQMVLDLRNGHYHVGTSVGGPRFSKVYLAGHSYGGQIAELEAYSFGDIDGLIVVSYTDVGQSAVLKQASAYATKVCATGGKPVTPGGPGGYSPFGDPAKATANLFNDVDPAVLRAAKPKLSIDPCGDNASLAAATAVNTRDVKRITVPTLLIAGGADKLFPPPALNREAALYTGTDDLQLVTIPKTAHAITLERTRDRFATSMRNWLRTH